MTKTIVALLISAAFLQGCGPSPTPEADREARRGDESVHRRYRFDVRIETPQGDVEGSGIMDAVLQPIVSSDGQRRAPRLTMEAIPIRLKDGRYVFMLTEANRYSWSLKGPWTVHQQDLEQGGTVEASPDSYPLFGYFADLDRPQSLVEFEASSMEDVVGRGIRLKFVRIARTESPAIPVMETVIPWISRIPRGGMSEEFCKKSQYGYYGCVSTLYFRRKNA